MPQERKIELVVSEKFVDERPKNFNGQSYLETMGYMAIWGNADLVRLYVAKDGEITGHYYRYDRDKDGEICIPEPKHYFTMGGIPDRITGKYSTHS